MCISHRYGHRHIYVHISSLYVFIIMYLYICRVFIDFMKNTLSYYMICFDTRYCISGWFFIFYLNNFLNGHSLPLRFFQVVMSTDSGIKRLIHPIFPCVLLLPQGYRHTCSEILPQICAGKQKHKLKIGPPINPVVCIYAAYIPSPHPWCDLSPQPKQIYQLSSFQFSPGLSPILLFRHCCWFSVCFSRLHFFKGSFSCTEMKKGIPFSSYSDPSFFHYLVLNIFQRIFLYPFVIIYF